ncbi:hypothetical protein HELRODRAFT_176485 [Helobdella robusta]|uniref:Uncharacterized protein n=1 Tax=Helobdella robusta TaxID=6412 RepID=T1FAK4_HELRO|nr:hypothetical protein HELRODRAFT_176485 [Helobdella robusta]ESN99725.1 hypothetical protein HELRODRAFT_176485 [Helobdella robusta]
MHIGSAWLGLESDVKQADSASQSESFEGEGQFSTVFQVHLSRLKLPEEFIVDDQNGCDVTLRSFIRWQRMQALLGLKLPKEFIVEDVRLRGLAPVLEDNVGTGPHSTFCLCRMDNEVGCGGHQHVSDGGLMMIVPMTIRR